MSMTVSAALTPAARSAMPRALAARSVATTPAAVLESVIKRYGKVEALRGLDLVLPRGEVIALLGPDGAGKTTAIRLLLGVISPSAGSVRVLGRDPRTASARTRIGAMLQITRMPQMLLVREHIALFRSYYPCPLAAAEVVRRAGLEGIEHRRFGELTGGQKQRVLFGLALCGDPDLIVMDEPTVGMDLHSRRRLWDEVRALASLLRTRTNLLAGIGVPVLFYLLFGTGHRGMPLTLHLFAGYCCLGIVSACLFGIGPTLALGRSQGWRDLKRATPMPRFAFLGAKVVSCAAFGLIIASVLMALASALGAVTVIPALPTQHFAQIALAVVGLAPASGTVLHWAVLGGITVLLLAAAWITFLRSQASA